MNYYEPSGTDLVDSGTVQVLLTCVGAFPDYRFYVCRQEMV